MSEEPIQSVRITASMVGETEMALREAGDEGFELFVLWAGIRKDVTFNVLSVHAPSQQSHRTATGLYVHVGGEELFRLNQWLYQHGQLLGVQVHTHPFDAYHSETDDAFPMVTRRGGLSIVVADFCQHGLLTAGTAVFHLAASGWVASDISIEQLLKVV